MAAPMEVSLPQTMLQKLLDLLKLKFIKVLPKNSRPSNLPYSLPSKHDYHNQHESAALIGLFHTC